MEKPAECRWCGCSETLTNRSDSVTFACRTYWDAHNGGVWSQWSDACGSHVGDLYRRIKRAIDALKNATRYELVRDEYGCYMKGRDSCGNWFDAIEVEQAIAILKGEEDGKAK